MLWIESQGLALTEKFQINKWQRFVALLAATVSLLHALHAYKEDDRISFSFAFGVMLIIASLSRPSSEDEWLPFASKINKSHLKKAAIGLACVAGLGLIGALLSQIHIPERNGAPRSAKPMPATHTPPVPKSAAAPRTPFPELEQYLPGDKQPNQGRSPARPSTWLDREISAQDSTIPFDYSEQLVQSATQRQRRDPVTETLDHMMEDDTQAKQPN